MRVWAEMVTGLAEHKGTGWDGDRTGWDESTSQDGDGIGQAWGCKFCENMPICAINWVSFSLMITSGGAKLSHLPPSLLDLMLILKKVGWKTYLVGWLVWKSGSGTRRCWVLLNNLKILSHHSDSIQTLISGFCGDEVDLDESECLDSLTNNQILPKYAQLLVWCVQLQMPLPWCSSLYIWEVK